ncbi:MAG: transposase family protein [Actinomycetales bacterium]|nr:transposase family protein [Actinomycetales bacterium]
MRTNLPAPFRPPVRHRKPRGKHPCWKQPGLVKFEVGTSLICVAPRGVAFKAYSIIDIFSRKTVGCRVEDREVDELAVDMFTTAFAEHGKPQTVHSDSGPAMRSSLLKDFLSTASVGQTHNRPRASNDNPFSDYAELRIMPNTVLSESVCADQRPTAV